MKTIGVIGLGSIGLRHAKNLLAMGHNVVGYDTDAIKMKLLMEVNDPSFEGLAGWFRPNSAVPESVVDGIIIATPSNQHVVELLEMRPDIPVLIEKPVGCTDGDVVFLRELLKPPRAPVMVGTNLRFHSCVKKAKEWLSAGLIGKPLWSNFTLAQYNTKYTEDVVLNWGSHELDLARYLLGPCWVKAAVGTRDIADIILMHDSGCRTTVHLDYVTEPEIRFDIIQGSEGAIEMDLRARTIGFRHKRDYFKEWEDFPASSFDLDYITEMQTFINMIGGVSSIEGWEVCAATGADGLAVLELCLEIKRLAGI